MTPITLGLPQIAALLGAVQGSFLAVVLATQRRNRTANRLLAVAMFVFSVSLTSAVYHAAGVEQRFPHFFGVGYPLPLLFGPLIYLYAVTASDSTRGLRRHDALHFLPFAVVVLGVLPIYMMSGEEKLAFYRGLLQGVVPPLVRVVDPLKFVSGVSYAAATLVFLRRHRARVKDSYSSIERVNLRWLFRLAVASAAIWALATGLEVTEQLYRPLLERADDAIALAIAALVYAIGYMALRQPEIFNFAAIDRRVSEPVGASGGLKVEAAVAVAPVELAPSELAPVDPVPPTRPAPTLYTPESSATPASASAPTPEPTGGRYERSGLTESEAMALERALLAVMEKERLYQNSDLTLADLAERLDTTPHKLSEVLNSRLQQTFYDFVNGYRVKDVQRRIADDRLKHLTILALALDAGFASKSTFNHVFRQHTGRTPTAYRKSLAR